MYGLLLEWEASLDKGVLATLHASGAACESLPGTSYVGGDGKRFGMDASMH